MKIILFLIIAILITNTSFAKLIKPNPNINSQDVIKIQLNALKQNNEPYKNAGIEQTWAFAHPFNRAYTGPIEKFTYMLYSPGYVVMIDHQNHNIIFISEDLNTAYYFIELTDKIGDKYGFQWTVKKVLEEGDYKDCWMTIGVSQPIPLAKAT